MFGPRRLFICGGLGFRFRHHVWWSFNQCSCIRFQSMDLALIIPWFGDGSWLMFWYLFDEFPVRALMLHNLQILWIPPKGIFKNILLIIVGTMLHWLLMNLGMFPFGILLALVSMFWGGWFVNVISYLRIIHQHGSQKSEGIHLCRSLSASVPFYDPIVVVAPHL